MTGLRLSEYDRIAAMRGNLFMLYLRTLRRLRFSQIWWRIRYVIRRGRIESGLGKSLLSRLLAECRGPEGGVPLDVLARVPVLRRYYPGDIHALRRNSFAFLNQTVDLGAVIDWRFTSLNPEMRLWKFTLNYQEYLVDVARHWRDEGRDSSWGPWLEAHVREWMRQNPLGLRGGGRDTWNTYCLSSRVVSWMRVWSLVGEWLSVDFKSDFLSWLWAQCRFASENIEYDILGNHIIRDWKAMAYASAFWGDRGARFSELAARLWRKYVRPQIDSDGQHEELSPMYGAIVLEDLLEGLAVQGASVLARETELLARMALWLERLHFGETWAHFNDSADGMAPTPSQLAAAYGKITGAPWPKADGAFATDAFVGARLSSSQVALMCGPATHGPQPGHVHAAACSVEWASNGRLIFSNAGVYEYNPGERRDFERSASAHNTATVAGHDLHEFWGAFRCARLGRCKTIESSVTDEGFRWTGCAVSHDGFYEHQRDFEAYPLGFRCRDLVSLRMPEKATRMAINWRLAPGLEFRQDGGAWTIVDSSTGVILATVSVSGHKAVHVGWNRSYPAYGCEVPVMALEVEANVGEWITTSAESILA